MERTALASALWLTLAAATMLASPVKAGKPSKEPPPPPPVQYDIAWLDTTGYSAGYASDINANTLVGTLYPGDGTSHAFLLNFNSKSDLSDPSRMVDINTLVTLPEGYRLSQARRITTQGRIAGNLVDNNGVVQPYVYDPSLAEPLTIIPNLLGTTSVYVRDMNERGDVLFSEHRDPANTGGAAFLYTADTDQVHFLRPEVVAPMAINDNRVITGNFRGDIPGGLIREGSWDSYTFDFTTDTLAPIPGKFRPADIANDGTVAGEYPGPKNTRAAAKHHPDVGVTPLTNVVATYSLTMNNAGQTSGFLNTNVQKYSNTVFLYSPDDGFWSINDLLNDSPEKATWLSSDATLFPVNGMSEPLDGIGYPLLSGERFIDGRQFIYTLVPAGAFPTLGATAVPEPASLFLAGVGALLVLCVIRHTQHD